MHSFVTADFEVEVRNSFTKSLSDIYRVNKFCFGHYDREFVSAESPESIHWAQRGTESFCNVCQNVIPNRVTVRIVNLLETVPLFYNTASRPTHRVNGGCQASPSTWRRSSAT